MSVWPDSAREVLDSAALAHLLTLNADGSPQVTCVGVGLEGNEIVCAHRPRQRKIDNVELDPRVSVSIEADGTNEPGLRNPLVVHGRARVTKGGAPELLQRLAHTYLGPEVVFPPMSDPGPGYITRVSTERITEVGPWVGDFRPRPRQRLASTQKAQRTFRCPSPFASSTYSPKSR